MEEQTGENLAHDFAELKRFQKCWSIIVLVRPQILSYNVWKIFKFD